MAAASVAKHDAAVTAKPDSRPAVQAQPAADLRDYWMNRRPMD